MTDDSDTEDDGTRKAATHTRKAADELEAASDAASNDVQADHLDDLREEAEKTADALDDAAGSEDDEE